MTKRTKPVFTVGGKPVLRKILPVSVKKVIAWLDARPFSKMYTNFELIEAVKVSDSRLRMSKVKGLFDGYWVLHAAEDTLGKSNRKVLWGSKQTIAAFKREVE